jgi:hypothetical protein
MTAFNMQRERLCIAEPELVGVFVTFADVTDVIILHVKCSHDAAQANNPLANMTAFNMQNYYIGDVSESDKDANQSIR